MLETFEIYTKNYKFNNELLAIPVMYIAYLDNEFIRNLNGDKIKIKNFKTNIENIKSEISIENEAIFVEKILDCDNNIINVENIILLIGNKLYTIFGEEIEINDNIIEIDNIEKTENNIIINKKEQENNFCIPKLRIEYYKNNDLISYDFIDNINNLKISNKDFSEIKITGFLIFDEINENIQINYSSNENIKLLLNNEIISNKKIFEIKNNKNKIDIIFKNIQNDNITLNINFVNVYENENIYPNFCHIPLNGENYLIASCNKDYNFETIEKELILKYFDNIKEIKVKIGMFENDEFGKIIISNELGEKIIIEGNDLITHNKEWKFKEIKLDKNFVFSNINDTKLFFECFADAEKPDNIAYDIKIYYVF